MENTGETPRLTTIEKLRATKDALIALKKSAFGRFKDPLTCSSLQELVGSASFNQEHQPHSIDWIPRHLDIARISSVIRLAGEISNEGRPVRVADIAGSTGFLARLLLSELDKINVPGVEIDIVDPDPIVTTQGRSYYGNREPRIRFHTKTAKGYGKSNQGIDVAICSWMRPEMNLRPDIEKLNPKLIVLVKDAFGDVGEPTAFEETEGYELVSSWRGITSYDGEEYLKDNGSGIVQNNIVLVFARRNLSLGGEVLNRIAQVGSTNEEIYPWERELPSTESPVSKLNDDSPQFRGI